MTIREDNHIRYSSREVCSYYYIKKAKLFKHLCKEANLDMRFVNGEIELSDCISDNERMRYFKTEIIANKIWNSIDEMQFTPTTTFQQAVFNRYVSWLKKENTKRHYQRLKKNH